MTIRWASLVGSSGRGRRDVYGCNILAALQPGSARLATSLRRGGQFPQHRVEGQPDAFDERRLVGKIVVALMNQHRGVDLEHDKLSRGVQSAVDSEIFKADGLPDRA